MEEHLALNQVAVDRYHLPLLKLLILKDLYYESI